MPEEDQAQKTSKQENKKKDKATCEHKNLKKEYDGGMETGDKICRDCGKLI